MVNFKPGEYVEDRFYPWFKFYFLLSLCTIPNYNDVLKTKETEIYTKDKTELQQIHGKVNLYVNK